MSSQSSLESPVCMSMGDLMGSTQACLYRKAKPFLPKPLKQHRSRIFSGIDLCLLLTQAFSLLWCNGGCLLKVLSWLMQLFSLWLLGLQYASFSFSCSLAVYSLPPSHRPLSEPACHYTSTSVGGSGSEWLVPQGPCHLILVTLRGTWQITARTPLGKNWPRKTSEVENKG